ncbi:acyl carrier protein [Robertkochia solimangrovi]|uniref:acyl carrier protein n=1 Tax=Robertkochia solimangrovi TaxID=2213046 RepID=UPI00117EEEFC|nr:acyl carrier protein [Robertkochia solimangrovi]TRZ42527.1 acyl carrier protein [Robertkochia solimangrovi]
MSEIIEKLNQVFKDVFEDESISISPETVAADIDTWDSLNHIYLVVEIENEFNVKFETSEVAQWKNVGDIIESLNSRLPS